MSSIRPKDLLFSRQARSRPHREATALVAEALITRALRRAGLHALFHGEPAILAVTGVRCDDADAVSDAVANVLTRRDRLPCRTGRGPAVHDWTDAAAGRSKTWRTQLLEHARAGRRAVALFETRADVPSGLEIVADGIVEFGPVDLETVSDAFRAIYGRVPPSADLRLAAELPLGTLGAVVHQGASLRRAVAGVRRLRALAAQAAAAESMLPAGPTLDDLHGLGEAGAWGRSLAVDIAEYRAGRIDWSDVDGGALVSGPPGTGKTTFAQALGRTCRVPVHLHSLAAWQAACPVGNAVTCGRRTCGPPFRPA